MSGSSASLAGYRRRGLDIDTFGAERLASPAGVAIRNYTTPKTPGSTRAACAWCRR
ncbi:MAG: hypothetical protein U1E17_06530 [Geminicoccaceae bacterium]